MAIGQFTNVTSSSTAVTTTGSFTSETGKYYILSGLCVLSQTVPSLVSSNGITFTLIRQRPYQQTQFGTTTNCNHFVYGGFCTAGSSGAITISQGSQFALDAVSGIRKVNPVVQSASSAGTNSPGSGGTLTCTLATFASSSNVTYAITNLGPNNVQKSGFTKLSSIGNVTTAVKMSADTTPSFVNNGATASVTGPVYAVMAVEFAPEPYLGNVLGPASPSTAINVGGTNAWSNPGNVASSNNAYAVFNSATQFSTAWPSGQLRASNFGLNVPAGAIVDGIKVEFERKGAGGNGTTNVIRDNELYLMKAGLPVGSNLADPTGNWPTTDAYSNAYGNDSEKWGTAWTPAELNDPGFGVALSVTWGNSSGGFTSSPSMTASVDHVRVTVYYTAGEPEPITATFNVTDEDDTFAATAEVVPPTSGTSDVIALLHMNEGTFDLRPTALVNSAPGGLTFKNQGSDDLEGGRFWFGGEGPFGQALNTQGDAGAGVAILCDQTIDVSKGLTHEGFFMDFDSDGRVLWELRENVAVDPAWWITVVSLPQGGDTWTLQLDMKLPGYSQLTVQTSVFTSNTTGNGNWVVTQWNDDGTFDIYVQGNRLLHTTQTFDVALTDAKFAIFGSYRGTFAGGLYSKLIGEFRFSKVQQYTGSTLAVPTERFPDPSPGTGPTEVTATLNVTDDVDTVAASVTVVVVGTSSGSDANDVLAASASVVVSAQLASTDDDDSLNAACVIGNPPVDLSLNVTDENDTVSAQVQALITAALAVVDAIDTAASAVTVALFASLTLTDADDTLVAVTTTGSTLNLDVTDAQDVVVASTVSSIVAALNVTDEADALQASTTSPTAVQPHKGGFYPSQTRSKTDTKRLERFKREQEDRLKAVEEAIYGKAPEEIQVAIAEEVQAIQSLITAEFLAQFAEGQELARLMIAELTRLENELIAQHNARVEAEYAEMEAVLMSIAQTRMGRNRFSLILKRTN